MSSKEEKARTAVTVALAGTPNSGKTTIFNQLTGGRQKVANWPGVTVERKEGFYTFQGRGVRVVDLPGTYSLSAASLDEEIARHFLVTEQPDLVVAVVDATNLERNLYLVLQLLELGCRVVVALNMMDMVERQGKDVDEEELAAVLRSPVVKTVAPQGRGIPELRDEISRISSASANDKFHLDYGEDIEQIIAKLEAALPQKNFPYPLRWVGVKLLEGDPEITTHIEALSDADKEAASLARKLAARYEQKYGVELETAIIEHRYAFLRGLGREVVRSLPSEEERISLTERIDSVVLNRFLGFPLFLAAVWIMFQLVFKLGNPLGELLDGFFGLIAKGSEVMLGELGAGSMLTSLVSDGIISGVGSVLVFMPNILLLFFIISLLEDTGYMARAAFVADRLMHALGLHGKSFIPLLLGFGCNIPGIMATRTLEHRKDRIITILITPFMSCSARLPVYILFAGAFFAEYQGWVVFALYLLGILVAFLSARLFRVLFFREEVAPLIMELPPYRMPMLKSVLWHMWHRGALFLRKAGTVIVACVVVVWALSSLPAGVEYASAQSIIGRIGTWCSPLLKPAGFGNWEATIALISGFVAKEAVVGTLGTVYGAGEEGLRAVLAAQFSPLSAISFLVFALLYVPCLPAMVMIWREAGKRWALFSIVYNTTVAWLLATLVFQLGRLFLS